MRLVIWSKRSAEVCVEYSPILFSGRKNIKKLALMAADVENNEARRYLWEELVARKPEEPYYWQQLASVCFDQNDYDHALCALEKFFSIECFKRPVKRNELYKPLSVCGNFNLSSLAQSGKALLRAGPWSDLLCPQKTLHMDEIFLQFNTVWAVLNVRL